MITIYYDGDTTGALTGIKPAAEMKNRTDITLELIDTAPLTAVIKYDNSDAEITIYIRDELHSNAKIAFQETAESGKLSSDEAVVQIVFNVAEGVNQYLNDNNLIEDYSALDEDKQGILFSVNKDGELISEVVEGKKRPDLLCVPIIGDPQMMRPYMDEIMKQTAMENMSAEELEEAAKAGDTDAMELLASAYFEGNDEIEKNPEKAYYWFVKLAESGSDEAMFDVALFTAKGFGTERNFAKAAEWMAKAAEAGDETAEQSAAWFKKLSETEEKAKAGDAQAQADLAEELMRLGGLVEQADNDKDYEESAMWAEKAVAQGNTDGIWVLALAYHHGRGVNKDINKAIELYKKGADAGSAECKHNLACEYSSGENIKKDAHKAFELFKEAAENGYGLAMRSLGRCYQFADGTAGNMKKAIEWYEKALEVIDDPELAQKTAMFKMMEDIDPGFGDDYPECDEEYPE